ncbi:lysoplasmalogenase [Gilvimarinus sp. F26214L]|uniref:lysoplasmalogenase n=1 Tax=Gilvimarinus sp. DZF01 TaxID=3461371 RepID=UPI004045510B
MTTTSIPARGQSAPVQVWLLVAFFLSAVAYIALSSTGLRGPWMAALKIVPIALVGVIALGRLSGPTRNLTLAALALSALGDVFLALDFPNQFVFGLGAFLLAQLTYAGNFLRNASFRNKRAVLRGLPILFAALLLALELLPAAGELAPAVLVYLLAIVLMALSAAAHRGDSALLFAGAVTFMISDSLIAVNKFVSPLPLAGVAVMATYYGAQLMLVLGLARAR